MNTIIIVSENEDQTRAIQRVLIQKHSVIVKEKAKSAIDYLKRTNTVPDLALVDIDMTPMNGFELCAWMRQEEKTRNIPVIFGTDNTDPDLELEAYSMGAVDYLVRPYMDEVLLRKVEMHLKMQEKNNQLKEKADVLMDNSSKLQAAANISMQNVINMQQFIAGVMTSMITQKDGFTGIHSKRVARLMQVLMREMISNGTLNLSVEDQNIIILGAQLFDMGKIGVADAILSKTGKYTPDEFDAMKLHTIIAADAIQNYSYLLPNNKFVMYTYHMCRSHHEQWCGRGYPDGLAGENIPILARMISICDIYDALVSERPYKKPIYHEQACEILKQASGVQLDPAVVSAFERVNLEFFAVTKDKI